jgi:hypothetical protein
LRVGKSIGRLGSNEAIGSSRFAPKYCARAT